MSNLVLIRDGVRPARYIDASPLQADRLGHVWLFDGGASDAEAPYTCVLCDEPQWRGYNQPCKGADLLGAANAERDAWIAEHRIEEAWVVASWTHR